MRASAIKGLMFGMFEQVVIAMFVIVGAAFACIGLGASWLLSPTNPTEGKGVTFESGVEPIGDPWIRFKPGYFMYAILFVIFDIEVAFIFPWAVALGTLLGWFEVTAMIVFVAIILVGLAYEYKEGVLGWH
ncbi:MAG: NADH-quinone oxidoreductase subunit A [Coriobacteriia bacterium]|nr:NADH-quinone oxidoreductase subunit A [Coriobacteriia bacterium]